MFEVDMRECGDGTVTLNNQCLDAVSSFLDFAYSGEILITDGNADTLFQLAAFLQVKCKPLLSFQFLYTVHYAAFLSECCHFLSYGDSPLISDN